MKYFVFLIHNFFQILFWFIFFSSVYIKNQKTDTQKNTEVFLFLLILWDISCKDINTLLISCYGWVGFFWMVFQLAWYTDTLRPWAAFFVVLRFLPHITLFFIHTYKKPSYRKDFRLIFSSTLFFWLFGILWERCEDFFLRNSNNDFKNYWCANAWRIFQHSWVVLKCIF